MGKVSAQPSPPPPSPQLERTVLPFSHKNSFCTLAQVYPSGYRQICPSLGRDDLDVLATEHPFPAASTPLEQQDVLPPVPVVVPPPPDQVQLPGRKYRWWWPSQRRKILRPS